MKDMARLLEKWQLNGGDVREQMYRAPTPRERERWHGLWLLVQGWSVLILLIFPGLSPRAAVSQANSPVLDQMGAVVRKYQRHSVGASLAVLLTVQGPNGPRFSRFQRSDAGGVSGGAGWVKFHHFMGHRRGIEHPVG